MKLDENTALSFEFVRIKGIIYKAKLIEDFLNNFKDRLNTEVLEDINVFLSSILDASKSKYDTLSERNEIFLNIRI